MMNWQEVFLMAAALSLIENCDILQLQIKQI